MDKAELLKNRLQASIDFAVKMNEDFEAISWNYQEGVLLSHNEAKLVVELIKKLTLTDVGNCPFEAYAVFCIECDRKGIKPIKYKDYLNLG